MNIVLIPNALGGRASSMRCFGEIVSLDNLPAPQTRRWVMRRKLLVASAAISGLLTEEELLSMYSGLSQAELRNWIETIQTQGIDALRATKTEELKSFGSDDVLPRPVEDFYVAQVDGLVLHDTRILEGVVDGEQRAIRLTGSEFKLLSYMMLNPGVLMPKVALMRYMYPNKAAAELKILDVFVCKIRKKLRETFDNELIETEWGRGYYIP